MGNNQDNKETWATKTSAWSTVAVAMATIALVVVTWIYVVHTGNQVEMQKQQFELANRAKLFPKYPNEIEGNVYGGAILVENKGNLPAEDFKLVWKVTKIDGGGEREEGEGELLRKKVKPDGIVEIPYKSYFKDKDEVVVLVAVWKYKSKGIEDYMIKDSSYLWDKYKEKWVLPYWLGFDHIVAVKSIKKELRKFLEQEENN